MKSIRHLIKSGSRRPETKTFGLCEENEKLLKLGQYFEREYPTLENLIVAYDVVEQRGKARQNGIRAQSRR